MSKYQNKRQPDPTDVPSLGKRWYRVETDLSPGNIIRSDQATMLVWRGGGGV